MIMSVTCAGVGLIQRKNVELAASAASTPASATTAREKEPMSTLLWIFGVIAVIALIGRLLSLANFGEE